MLIIKILKHFPFLNLEAVAEKEGSIVAIAITDQDPGLLEETEEGLYIYKYLFISFI